VTEGGPASRLTGGNGTLRITMEALFNDLGIAAAA